MARSGFKRIWRRLVPEEAERSTYVLFASAALALLCWLWRALPALIWSVDRPVAAAAVLAIPWCDGGVPR